MISSDMIGSEFWRLAAGGFVLVAMVALILRSIFGRGRVSLIASFGFALAALAVIGLQIGDSKSLETQPEVVRLAFHAGIVLSLVSYVAWLITRKRAMFVFALLFEISSMLLCLVIGQYLQALAYVVALSLLIYSLKRD